MRITKHTDYALRVLLYLATHPAHHVSTQRIADAHGISRSHLQKVVRSLAELGLVELQRGARGGVRLLADPAEISVGAVVRALDDEDALVECFRPETDACAISPACRLKGALRVAEEAFYAALDSQTIADATRGRNASRLRVLTDG